MLDFIGSWKEVMNWLMDQPKEKKFRITEWHPRRSRSANAYFHVLSDRIADARTLRGDTISKAAEKNELIGKYGQMMLLPNGQRAVFKSNVPPDAAKEWEGEHLFFLKYDEDPNVYWYRLMRHTATYDSREMAALIDGTQEDAKAWGVEVLTPEELKRLEGYEKSLH